MKIFINAISDIGCVRTNNEDMILINQDIFRNDKRKYEFELANKVSPFLISVADGMGGHKCGEYASERVLLEMNKLIRSIPTGLSNIELKKLLEKEIKSIHTKLLEEGNNDPLKNGMGSTFIGILLYDSQIYLINIGDSRCYRFREGILTQMSRDHSLKEMSNSTEVPNNIIVNSFGAGAKIFFDFEEITKRIISDDTIIICSDGLTNEVSDVLIEKIFSHLIDPTSLVKVAKKNGGKDNISIVTIHFKEN